MPAPNLVSATLPAADKAAVLAALQTIKEKLPFLISLPVDQQKKLRKAASKRMGYVQDVSDGVKSFPDELPRSFDTQEFLKDAALFTELGEIVSAFDSLNEMLTDTRIQLGSELMVQSDTAYGMLKAASKNNGAVKTVVQKIGAAFKGQGKKAVDAAKASK